MGSIEFDIVSVLGTGAPGLTGVTDLEVSADAAEGIVYTVTQSGAVSAFRVTESGLQKVDEVSLPSPTIAGIAPELAAVTVDGAVTVMATGAGGLWSLDSTDSGTLSGAAVVPGGLPTDLAECVSLSFDGASYMVGTRLGAERPGLWLMNANGSFTEIETPPAPSSDGVGATAMRAVTLGGKPHVLTAAAGSNEFVVYRVAPNGLSIKDKIGAEDGVGIATPTALALVETGGVTYALMGAAGSNSLTVAAVGADGQFTVTDHIIDSLDTRFAGVTTLETMVIDGRAFAVAAGSDDGISLFEVLPGGTLLHHGALADGLDTTLDNIADIGLSASGDTLLMTVASSSESGLTLLSAATPGAEALIVGGAGNDALIGGTTDDVLMDGAGVDTITGGAGADVFVLAWDGETDVIRDFQYGVDSLDLSSWAFLRSAGQITVIETSTGAELWFEDERLVIETASGQTLTAAQIGGLDLLSVDRILPAWVDAVIDPEPEPTAPDDSGKGAGFGEFSDLGEGNSQFSAKGGSDTVRGNAGDDTITGDSGSDYLDGGDDDDHINAGQGADTVFGNTGDDKLEGKEGHDWLDGGAGNDTITGDFDRDTLYGGSGNDSLKGIKGYDVLYGGIGDDTLSGGEGYDELYGGDGHDLLEGGVSNDTMDGGDGNDTLLSNQGSDVMDGGGGNDSMRGHDGHDTMMGGAGSDTLSGGVARDLLDGGAGDDLLIGGEGSDVFRFTGGNDTIVDFTSQDAVQIDRDLWPGLWKDLMATAEVTDAGLTLQLGADQLLFEDVTNASLVGDALSFF